MKHKLLITLATVLSVITMSACDVGTNKQIVDFTYNFNYAYILLPNGECVEGEVESWKDFEDGDQLQIKINGVTYLTDTTRAVLVNK